MPAEIGTIIKAGHASTELYLKIIERLLSPQAFATPDAYPFLKNVRGLTLSSQEGNNLIVFDATPESVAAAKRDVVASKRQALRSFLDVSLSAGGRPRIEALFPCGPHGDGGPPDAKDGVQGFARWEEIRKEVKAFSVGPNDDDAALNAHIGKIDGWISEVRGREPDVFRRIDGLGATKSQALKALPGFFNAPEIDDWIKNLLVDSLFAETTKSISKNNASMGNLSNKTRPYKIFEGLDFPDGSIVINGKTVLDSSPTKELRTVDQEKYRLIYIALKDLFYKKIKQQTEKKCDFSAKNFNNLLYSKVVMKNIYSNMNNKLKEQSGLAALDIAKTTTFDQSKALNSALQRLVDTVNRLIASATLNVKWRGDGAAEKDVASLQAQPYPIKNYYAPISKTYATVDADDQNAFNTTANSLPAPLIEIKTDGARGQLRFLNARFDDEIYYATAIETPDELKFYVSGKASPVTMCFRDATRSNLKASRLRDKFYLVASYWQNKNWSFEYRRKYVSLYKCMKDNIESHLLWLPSSGFGGGLGRADGVESQDYVWAFGGDLGELRDEMKEHVQLGDHPDWDLTVDDIAALLDLDPKQALSEVPVTLSGKGLSRPADSGPAFELKFYDEAHGSSSSGTRFQSHVIQFAGKPADSFVTPAADAAITPPASAAAPSDADDPDADDPDADAASAAAPSAASAAAPSAASAEVARYVLCQTPYQDLRQMTQPLALRSRHFTVYYFRRLLDGATSKVIKTDLKNRPWPDDVPSGFRSEDGGMVAVNPPISLHSKNNQTAFNELAKELAMIKNKGNLLGRPMGPREAAGGVMSSLRQFAGDTLGIGSGPTLSADDLATAVAANLGPAGDGAAKSLAITSWQDLKDSNQVHFPTAQEWCHLMGHGDSGPEAVGNLVCASKHCNTEQLAIEIAQRPTTQKGPTYHLNCTAYLLRDRSMRVIPLDSGPSTYLSEPNLEYRRRGYQENLTYRSKNTISDIDIDARYKKDLERAGVNAPIAAFIRYKIYSNEKGHREKLFDYVFEGQSEFIDYNQFSIIGSHVQFAINPEEFYRKLANVVLERLLTSADG